MRGRREGQRERWKGSGKTHLVPHVLLCFHLVHFSRLESTEPAVRALVRLHALFADPLLLPDQDHLSTLPVELLEWIFELAYEGRNTTTGPISRALLPFDRKERFKEVEVVGVQQLWRFCKLIKRRPHLCHLFATLHLNGCDADAEDPAHPKHKHLQLLFSALTKVRSISIGVDCDLLTDFFLSPSTYGVFSSTLEALELTPLSCDGREFFRLNGLPYVRHLTLNLEYCEDVYDFTAFNAPGSRIRYVSSLTLRGGYLDSSSLAVLLNTFHAVTTLLIDSEADEPSFHDLMWCPDLPLTSLSLRTVTWFDDYSAPCDQYLSHFPRLTSLALGEGILDHTTLFSNLRRLSSLSSLTFNTGAIVAVSDLLSLISGPTRHSRLLKLQLDMLTPGMCGWRVLEDGEGTLHRRHKPEKKHVAPDWTVPEFSDPDERFSTFGVEELVRVGKENGVEVRGTAVEGIKVYREWRKEAVECLLVYGLGKGGDYGELREFVGEEEAKKLLEEKGFEEKQVE